MPGALENRLAARLARPCTRLTTTRTEIALTFDDGPDRVWTARVLDVLAEHQAKATFFLVGERAVRESALVRRAVDEGHAVGSHSFGHEQLLELDGASLRRAVLNGRDAVEQVTGRSCPLFRPPRGHLDLRTARLIRRAGLQMWMWSVECGDWRPKATVDSVLACADGLAAGDVVLLHDALAGSDAPPGSQDRSTTLAALPLLLRRAQRRGLACVVLPQAPHPRTDDAVGSGRLLLGTAAEPRVDG